MEVLFSKQPQNGSWFIGTFLKINPHLIAESVDWFTYFGEILEGNIFVL